MIRPAWDVAVVGAGPAGSTTAALLARRGMRVLLLDRTEFPRSKACGESVNPGAVEELRDLGLLEGAARLGGRQVLGWRIRQEGGAEFRGHFPPGRSALAIDRAAFDSMLVDHAVDAGAELRTRALVIELTRGRDGVTGVVTRGGERHRAGLVVGADGLRSVVVRRLGLLARRPVLRKIGLTAHVEGMDLEAGTGELHLRAWGCVGIVAVAAGVANVAFVLHEGEVGRLRRGAEAAFDDLLREIPPLAGARRRTDVHRTGPFDWPTRDVVADGALLVGDAAGYFDPFTGQGIYRALRGARHAAAAIERALAAGVPSAAALRPYARAHRAEFRAGERLQRIVEATISRPPVMTAVAALFSRIPTLADRLVAITGDVRPARSLLLPGRG